jgi:hypothetical protein
VARRRLAVGGVLGGLLGGAGVLRGAPGARPVVGHDPLRVGHQYRHRKLPRPALARSRSSIAACSSCRSRRISACALARADVEGRLDDAFSYAGGVVVHPHVFRSALAREAWIVQYQVQQTPDGAEVRVIGAPGDPEAVGRALEKELAQVGVRVPCVDVRVGDQLERLATGKVRRFQPIPG